MQHPRLTTHFVLFLLFCQVAFATSRPRDRIVARVNDADVTVMAGGLHPRARAQVDVGVVPGTYLMQNLLLSFRRSAEQENSLAALLGDLQDPKSPIYQHWLTPEQFAARFGVSESDYAKTKVWLESHGFTITGTARNRMWIAFDGTAAEVSSTFHTQIHQYKVNGRLQYANATELSIPAALANVVGAVRLHNFKPNSRSHRLNARFTSNQSNNKFLAPDDFATIYDLHGLYNAGIDGTGQKIAVMGQTSVDYANVSNFRSLSGLSASTVTDVPIGTTQSNSSDLDEAYLDIEWAGAIAPKAQIIYVHADQLNSSGAFDALKDAITNNRAPVISISYGDCESNFSANDIDTITGWLQEAVAQGQTIVTPSGDDGATDCDYPLTSTASVTSATHGLAVDIPASFPYVTAVGGTTFNEGSGDYWNTTNNSVYGSAKSYIPEVAWNDTLADLAAGAGSFAASGGGKSKLFSKPSWQAGTGVPPDDARFVPDLSLAASVDHDGYLTCAPGFCVHPSNFPDGFRDVNNVNLSVVGGTSAGVPAFAGIVALINQKRGHPQGNLNPTLYAMAASMPSAFHDITDGDNKVPCTSGTKDCASGGTIGYLTGVRYDPVTGLGSVDASVLVNNWLDPAPSPDFTIVNPSSSLTVTHSGSSTVTLKFFAENGFTGSLNLTCTVSSGLGGTSCSVPSTVTPSNSVNVSITAASKLAVGPKNRSPFLPDASFAVAFGFLFLGRGSRKRWAMLLSILVIAVLVSMSSCGGGGSSGGGGGGTTPLTGTVTVTAANGTVSHSTIINLTVN